MEADWPACQAFSHVLLFLFPLLPTLAAAGVEIFAKPPRLAHFPLCTIPVRKCCHMATQRKAFSSLHWTASLKATSATHRFIFVEERREKERENIHRSQNPSLFGRMAFKWSQAVSCFIIHLFSKERNEFKYPTQWTHIYSLISRCRFACEQF